MGHPGNAELPGTSWERRTLLRQVFWERQLLSCHVFFEEQRDIFAQRTRRTRRKHTSRRKENKRGIAGSRWLPRDYPKALLLPLFPFKHVHPTRYEELFCGYGVPVLRVRCE